MAVAVIAGLLSVPGCTKTVYVTTTEAPVTTEAPGELRSGFTVDGYEIEPGANLEGADLTVANLTDANLTGTNLRGSYLGFADLTGAMMPDGWQDIVAAN